MSANAVTITLDQMDRLLAPQGFTTIVLPGVNEVVFAKGLHIEGEGWKLPLSIRIYTSIEGVVSRGVGEDAIRVSVWTKQQNTPVMLCGSKRVHRVEHWRENLAKRLDAWRDMLDQTCPRCKAPMILRKPKNGQHWQPFYGCCRYPDCKGTR